MDLQMASRIILLRNVTAGVLVVISILFFCYLYPENLFQKELNPQFSYTYGCFFSYFDKPAWLACYIGDLLAHVFIPLGGGPLLITGTLLLEWMLLISILKKFNIGEMASLFALLPIMMEWGGYCSEKYLLTSLLSFIISLIFLLLFFNLKSGKQISIWGILFLPIIYFLAGSWLSFYVVMILLNEVGSDEKRWLFWSLLLVLGVLLPNLMQYIYGITQEVAYLYPLPSVPAFFPAIMFCSSLLLMQTGTFKEMKANLLTVSVTICVLFAVLGSSMSLYADF